MDQTHTSTTSAQGQQIYDEIMGQIEPELLSTVLPTLKEKYKDETPQQAQERNARYDAAFAEYDKRYAQYMVDLSTKVHALQRTVRADEEKDVKTAEAQELSSLESSISSL